MRKNYLQCHGYDIVNKKFSQHVHEFFIEIIPYFHMPAKRRVVFNLFVYLLACYPKCGDYCVRYSIVK